MKSTLITILSIIPFFGFSQIVVNSTQAPEQLIQNVLLGNGVNAFNFTYNGSAANVQNPQGNVSFFDASNTTFPISSGVLLTSGNGVAAVGPNNSGSHSNNDPATPDVSGDQDLSAIASGNVTNGVFLEFDFIPAGDTISFKYVFASEEYPEYAPPNNSMFNDAFGFFLSGPNINGTFQNNAVNLAVLPGTSTPVTINNVNPITNNTFYVNNLNGVAYGSAIQYDGTTVVLSAGAKVQCGQTYHIKMAICNVLDDVWDSGVFIEANSFGSDAVEVSVSTVTGDSTVIEGCTDANFIFTRPSNQLNDTLIVNYTIFGTAIEGVDYIPLVNPIVFLPGEDTVILNFTPIQDGIDEENEFITIQVLIINNCGDTLITEGTVYILDKLTIDVQSTDVTVSCPNNEIPLPLIVSGGLSPYTYAWNDGQTTNPAIGSILQPGSIDYIVTVTDICGFTQNDTINVTFIEASSPTILFTDSIVHCPNTNVVLSVSATGGAAPYTFSWFDGTVGTSYAASIIEEGTQLYPITVIDACGFSTTDTVSLTFTQLLRIDSLNTVPTTECYPQGSVQVFVSGNSSTPNYLWVGPGSNSTQNSNQNLWSDLPAGWYYITVTEGTCIVVDSVEIQQINHSLSIDSLLSTPTSACVSDGSVNAIISGAIGTPTYEWIGPGTIDPDTVTTISWIDISAGWYYFEVTDGECSVMDSVLVSMNNAPEAIISPSTTSGCSPLEVSFLNGSLNATTFTWDFGDGQLVNVSSQATQNFTFTEDAVVTLVANQGPCFATAQVQITISTCGCTDPLAINFNPLATVDDGSCQFPFPTIEVPNVFTPNDDNSNDVFSVQVTNATNVQLTILNRWGNVMFESSGISPVPSWNGLDKSGAKAGEGTYFYKYIVTGYQGDTLEGHGFLQLIRN